MQAPARGLTIREAFEEAMAEGRGVRVIGGSHTWGNDILAVWPSAHLHVSCEVAETYLIGLWELAELSQGSITGGNLSYCAHDVSSQTLLVRGSSWVFNRCDIRSFQGVAVRVTNGYQEIASAGELAPFQLSHAFSDPQARVLPSNVSLELCGVGGLDPDRFEREGHLDPEQRQARSALDVSDTSEARMLRCSVFDTSVFSLRVYHNALLEVERCHISHSLSGIQVLNNSTLRLRMSCVEKIWFGAAVSAHESSCVEVLRCDLKHCSTGLISEGSSTVRLSYSALINCTFSAFHQVETSEEAEHKNNCNVTLTGNSVYSTMSGQIWWDRNRPRTLVLTENLFEDQEPEFTGEDLAAQYFKEQAGMTHAERAKEREEEKEAERQENRYLDELDDYSQGMGEGGGRVSSFLVNEEEEEEWAARKDYLKHHILNDELLDSWIDELKRDVESPTAEQADAATCV